MLAASPTKALGDIVTFIRPMATPSKEGEVKAWEVGAADLPEVAYISSPIKEVGIASASVEKNRHQFLQPLDIVLIIKGSVGRVGIVPENVPPPGEGGWIVGQSGVILRVSNHDIINPKALVMYLRSPVGQRMLEGIAVKGATIPLIQQRELQKLPIIIPPKHEATEIGYILDKQAYIQQEIEQLRIKQIELAQRLWSLD
jgi:type I restriction enzyme M protein